MNHEHHPLLKGRFWKLASSINFTYFAVFSRLTFLCFWLLPNNYIHLRIFLYNFTNTRICDNISFPFSRYWLSNNYRIFFFLLCYALWRIEGGHAAIAIGMGSLSTFSCSFCYHWTSCCSPTRTGRSTHNARGALTALHQWVLFFTFCPDRES